MSMIKTISGCVNCGRPCMGHARPHYEIEVYACDDCESIDYLSTGKENDATNRGDGSMYGLWNKYCMLDNDDKDTIDGLIDTLLSKEKYNKKPDQKRQGYSKTSRQRHSAKNS